MSAQIVPFPQQPKEPDVKTIHACFERLANGWPCPMPATKKIKLIDVDSGMPAGSKWYCHKHFFQS